MLNCDMIHISCMLSARAYIRRRSARSAPGGRPRWRQARARHSAARGRALAGTQHADKTTPDCRIRLACAWRVDSRLASHGYCCAGLPPGSPAIIEGAPAATRRRNGDGKLHLPPQCSVRGSGDRVPCLAPRATRRQRSRSQAHVPASRGAVAHCVSNTRAPSRVIAPARRSHGCEHELRHGRRCLGRAPLNCSTGAAATTGIAGLVQVRVHVDRDVANQRVASARGGHATSARGARRRLGARRTVGQRRRRQRRRGRAVVWQRRRWR